MSIQSLTAAFAASVALGLISAPASAALSSYSQDFESLDAGSGTALQDGWVVGANVFEKGAGANGEGNFVYNYFAFPAPNGTGAFSNVTTSNVPVGSQGLVVFSDYNNADHGNANRRIESIFFREWTVDVADVGSIWEFSVIAAPGDLGGASTAQAFIKTLDPGAGYSVTNFITADTTSLPAGNSPLSLQIDITNALVGQVLQIGFSNWASDFNPSGVNYDNVSFAQVPEPGSIALIGLGSLALMRRRRRA